MTDDAKAAALEALHSLLDHGHQDSVLDALGAYRASIEPGGSGLRSGAGNPDIEYAPRRGEAWLEAFKTALDLRYRGDGSL